MSVVSLDVKIDNEDSFFFRPTETRSSKHELRRNSECGVATVAKISGWEQRYGTKGTRPLNKHDVQSLWKRLHRTRWKSHPRTGPASNAIHPDGRFPTLIFLFFVHFFCFTAPNQKYHEHPYNTSKGADIDFQGCGTAATLRHLQGCVNPSDIACRVQRRIRTRSSRIVPPGTSKQVPTLAYKID